MGLAQRTGRQTDDGSVLHQHQSFKVENIPYQRRKKTVPVHISLWLDDTYLGPTQGFREALLVHSFRGNPPSALNFKADSSLDHEDIIDQRSNHTSPHPRYHLKTPHWDG